MGRARVGSWGAAAAAVLVACGDARVAQTPLAGESSCAGCHTAPGEPPPFRDPNGSTDTTKVTVGAHDPHLHAEFARPLSCGDCHKVPETVTEPGHLETVSTIAKVQFGELARTGGANPIYVGNGCLASYCHGNFFGGNRTNAPQWLGGQAAGQCGTCHAIPPTTGRHVLHRDLGIACDQCHGPFVQDPHLNGTVDIALTGYERQFKNCTVACHAQPRAWPGLGDQGR